MKLRLEGQEIARKVSRCLRESGEWVSTATIAAVTDIPDRTVLRYLQRICPVRVEKRCVKNYGRHPGSNGNILEWRLKINNRLNGVATVKALR
jgi:hypothetical protein